MSAHNFIDLAGQKFGFLTAVSQAERANRKVPLWNCLCSCGKPSVVAGKHLRGLKIISCGCFRKDVTSVLATTHGRTDTPEYKVWCGMKRRCTNMHDKSYPRYGGAGIQVCPQWLHSFDTFLADMGERPSDDHSIDRIDGARGYEAKNCRWVLDVTQNRNRRSNVFLTFEGRTMVIADWSVRTGIADATLRARLRYGWSVERVLTEKPRSAK